MQRPAAQASQKFNLGDYRAPVYVTDTIELAIDLTTTPARVKSQLRIRPNPSLPAMHTSLLLDGEKMELVSVYVNDIPLSQEEYTLTENSLTIHANKVPIAFEFTVSIETLIQNHADLFGKYEVDGVVLIKAETQGMRRVTYMQDSPDVRSKYEVTLIGDKKSHPILLCNGVLTKEYDLSNGRHAAVWSDDVPKPSYLFAMVAGHLAKRQDKFITRSGREVPIILYADHASLHKCSYAIEVIKQAWRFDEEIYGVECDLPEHKVVGIAQYAAGASETTTLNLFNLQNLVAEPSTSSDKSFLQTANTVSHEVFHGWSGNHVTIRDWFNLSVKEGLTVYRAYEWLGKFFGSALIRTMFGKIPDESSASRPDSYVSVRNLYSLASYDKAAEIFRMMMLMMGESVFHQAVHEFLVDHDGQSVTLEDMLESMCMSSGMNLLPTLSWFTESGFVDLQVEDHYDEVNQRYSLTFKQSSTAPNYKVRPIPVLLGLLDHHGDVYENDTLIIIDQAEQTISFDNMHNRPVPSLLRSYSALVKLKYEYSDDDLLLLMQFDTDFPNRRIAFNKYIISLVRGYCAGNEIHFNDAMLSAYRKMIVDTRYGLWERAMALEMTSEEELVDELGFANINQIREARKLILTTIANELHGDWQAAFINLQSQPDVEDTQLPGFDVRNAGKRAMIACCQKYLACVAPDAVISNLRQQFKAALGANMNDALSALNMLSELNTQLAQQALDQFYSYYQGNQLAINYWFGVQASAHSENTVAKVRQLLQHPAFKMNVPSVLLSLFRPFVRNVDGFHARSGAGYELLADVVIQLDQFNPQMASSLVGPLTRWDSCDKERQKLMYMQLQRLLQATQSKDVREKIIAALQKGNPLSTSPLAGRLMALPQTVVARASPETEQKLCKHK